MTTPTMQRQRLPLAIRIFLLLVVLLGAALGAAVLVSYRQSARVTEEAVTHAMTSSSMVQSQFAERRLQDVQLKLQLLVADQNFVTYIADAQGGAPGLDSAAADAGSIVDLLLERQESFGFDLGMVLDPEGQVLARTDQIEAVQESLAEHPLAQRAIAELTPLSGYARFDDKVYQAAIWPLDQDQNLIGFLIIALAVDDAFGKDVASTSGAEIAYLLPVADRIAIVGSSLAEADRTALQAAVDADAGGIAAAVRSGSTLERATLQLRDRSFIARVAPLDAEGGAELGAALSLTSGDAAAAGYREIVNAVAITGLIVLVIALPLSLLLAKASLRPLSVMAKAAADAAGGNYQARLAIEGNDELAQLARSFDSLLSDLRSERDMESYVRSLSRLLPDGAEEAPANAATAAANLPEFLEQRRELLVAVESRPLAQQAQGGTPSQLLQTAGNWTDNALAAAQACSGRLVCTSGARAVFGFDGEQRQMLALQFLRYMMQPDTAAAAIEGDAVSGRLNVGDLGFPVLFGIAAHQLERLLGESAGGHVVLPRALGDAIKASTTIEPAVVKGAVSGKAFYALTTDALQALPPLTHEDASLAGTSTVVTPASTSGQHGTATSAGRGRGPSGDLLPGQRFGGRYEILSVLGTGGMGVVYKARDRELDDVVALKMLKPAALGDGDHLERLKSEIRLARKITHPHVLRTFDFGEHDGLPYISMEYVRGMTLRYLLKQSGRVPYTAALRIARHLCAGLHAAHAVGVLHRDIKPENLILEASGNAKLMDFGIARPIRRTTPGSTEAGMYLGTPHYSAPEQLAGNEVDARVDIYASGVLMCEMFAGRLPYDGANTLEIYMAQMNTEPVKPSEAWPDIPPELEAILLRCIQRDPAARYPDAASLGEALSSLRA